MRKAALIILAHVFLAGLIVRWFVVPEFYKCKRIEGLVSRLNQQLTEERAHLINSQELGQVKNVSPVFMKKNPYSQESVLNHLSLSILGMGVLLKHSEILASQEEFGLTGTYYHFSLEGSYDQFVHFLNLLIGSSIVVEAFNISRLQDSRLKIELTLLDIGLPFVRKVNVAPLGIIRDPFQSQRSKPTDQYSGIFINNRLHYVGYAAIGRVRIGILRLPDGSNNLIKPGMILNFLQRAQVLDVNEKFCRLRVASTHNAESLLTFKLSS